MTEPSKKYQAPNSFVRVGDVMGKGFPPDPARPNEEGGATPRYYNAATRELEDAPVGQVPPLYTVFARCPKEGIKIGEAGVDFFGCGKQHRHLSTQPQYDDEGLRSMPCEDCITRQLDERRNRELREIAEAKAARPQRRKKREPEPTLV